MPTIRHMAMCTENNRRLARFYRLIFGMEEVWNYEQNSPHAFYISDGYFNLNCLQIHRTMAEQKRDVGINHYGFKVESIKEIGDKLGQWNPPIKFADRPKDGRYTRFVSKIRTATVLISPRRAGVRKKKRGIPESATSAFAQPIQSVWPIFTGSFLA
jgi:hypothetical protein